MTRKAGTLHEDIVHLLCSLAEFLLEREMFQIKFEEKIKTHFLIFNNLPPPENRAVYEITCKKYGIARQATNDNTAHAL